MPATLPSPIATEAYPGIHYSHAETKIERVGSGLTAEVCLACGRVIRQLESEGNRERRVQFAIDLKRLLACPLDGWSKGYVTALLGLKRVGPSQFKTIEKLKTRYLHSEGMHIRNENKQDASTER